MRSRPPPSASVALPRPGPRLQRTTSAPDLRRALAASAWGDPGGESPREITLWLRTTLADRVVAAVPEAGVWASGATALLVAREVFLEGRRLPEHARLAASRVIGPAAVSATSLPELAAALPARARWALADVDRPDALWRAEARWWARVDEDATALVRHARTGRGVLVGAVGLMAVDAWRVRAALEVAARGGGPTEALDAVA